MWHLGPQGAPNEGEMENLARYLLAGGFVMAEEFDFDGIWTDPHRIQPATTGEGSDSMDFFCG